MDLCPNDIGLALALATLVAIAIEAYPTTLESRCGMRLSYVRAHRCRG